MFQRILSKGVMQRPAEDKDVVESGTCGFDFSWRRLVESESENDHKDRRDSLPPRIARGIVAGGFWGHPGSQKSLHHALYRVAEALRSVADIWGIALVSLTSSLARPPMSLPRRCHYSSSWPRALLSNGITDSSMSSR